MKIYSNYLPRSLMARSEGTQTLRRQISSCFLYLCLSSFTHVWTWSFGTSIPCLANQALSSLSHSNTALNNAILSARSALQAISVSNPFSRTHFSDVVTPRVNSSQPQTIKIVKQRIRMLGYSLFQSFGACQSDERSWDASQNGLFAQEAIRQGRE